MSVNPDLGVNAALGVDAGLGTAEARAMRDRAAARRAGNDQREAGRRAATPGGDLLFKVRELQARCVRLEARHPADLLPRRYSLATGGGGGGKSDHPFKIIKVDATHVRVVYGSVNGAVATNSGNGSSLTVTAQVQVWVKITWNTTSNTVTSAVVESGASVPANTDSVSYYGLGTVYFQNGAVVDPPGQGVTRSLSAERYKCGTAAAQYFYAGV